MAAALLLALLTVLSGCKNQNLKKSEAPPMAAYTLTNPNADETTKSVYKYLCSLNGETTLSAQQESTWM